ncbi:MAG: YbaK/EbsC family protein [Christensenellales bacterium]|jgi:prolyl-tRNA editing enzyme YbaK/EbsC (Cys-tRNA(Pro) deacylase)
MSSIDAVQAYFDKNGFAGEILTFEVSSATVPLAAQALGCEEARIAKTLSYLVNGQPVLVVAAGDARVDNRKFKDAFGAKARMLTPEQAEELVGHRVGGVCPFAVKPGVQVYLDTSLQRFDTVFPACGSANSAVEMTIPELERLSNSLGWVEVCRLPDSV